MTYTPEPFDGETNIEAQGAPDEEGLSEAKMKEQLRTDPEDVPNATDPEGGPRQPKMSPPKPARDAD
jgi:hypothetical protein